MKHNNLPSLRTESNSATTSSVIVNDIEFNLNKSYLIFGIEIDIISFYIIFIAMIFMTIMWYYLGLFSSNPTNKIFYSIFMLFFFVQIFQSATLSGSISFEDSKSSDTDQMNATFLSSLVIMIALLNYTYKIDMNTNKKLISVVILSILLHTIVSVKQNGDKIRLIRKIKQYFFNVVIFTSIALIYDILNQVK